MTTLFAPAALLPDGWARDVRVTLDGRRIAAVEAGPPPSAGDQRLAGRALLPAMPNLHSHAFQRAMAGMTERRGPGDDSFWTWRELMYRFLDVLTPEDVEAIAALAYVEMLEAGFASVAEFHYLHHQPGGAPYADPAELAHRIAAAAADDRHRPDAAAGALQLRRGRRRAARRRPAALRLRPRRLPARCARRRAPACAGDAVLGAAPHSLRATTPGPARRAGRGGPGRPDAHPRRRAGAGGGARSRPGSARGRSTFLLDRVRPRPALVPDPLHADDRRTRPRGSPRSRRGRRALPDHRGEPRRRHLPRRRPTSRPAARFGVGSDFERPHLRSPRSCAASSTASASRDRPATCWPRPAARSARTLYAGALAGGAQALGAALRRHRARARWPTSSPSTATTRRWRRSTTTQLLDGWIFAADDRVVREVWSAGRHVVRDGRHVARDGRRRRATAGRCGR